MLQVTVCLKSLGNIRRMQSLQPHISKRQELSSIPWAPRSASRNAFAYSDISIMSSRTTMLRPPRSDNIRNPRRAALYGAVPTVHRKYPRYSRRSHYCDRHFHRRQGSLPSHWRTTWRDPMLTASWRYLSTAIRLGGRHCIPHYRQSHIRNVRRWCRPRPVPTVNWKHPSHAIRL
jgi:hypothetical protein